MTKLQALLRIQDMVVHGIIAYISSVSSCRYYGTDDATDGLLAVFIPGVSPLYCFNHYERRRLLRVGRQPEGHPVWPWMP